MSQSQVQNTDVLGDDYQREINSDGDLVLNVDLQSESEVQVAPKLQEQTQATTTASLTTIQRCVFALYMGLWMTYGLLNQYAKEHKLPFNSTTAVLIQTTLKAIISFGLYLRHDGNLVEMCKSFRMERRLFLLYLIPASLYALYDVLAYINLQVLDPATYFLLLQSRIVLTGVLHQYLFQHQLSKKQWFALFVTSLGCLMKTWGDFSNASSSRMYDLHQVWLVLLQVMASTLAGLYNEKLLKQVKLPLNLQNLFLYTHGIFWLLLSYLHFPTSQIDFKFLMHPVPWMLIGLMACVGIVTSLFLKLMGSVRKALASALELVFLPLLSWVFFQTPLTLHLVGSIFLVSLGVYWYAQPASTKNLPK